MQGTNNQVTNNQVIITQELVDLHEKKVDKNKPQQLIKFLQSVASHPVQFESTVCYAKFLQVLKKATLQESTLYESSIRLFKSSLGLPDNAFEEKVLLIGQDASQTLFSKELLEIFYPFFKASFASEWKESVATDDALYQINVPLSEEALRLFKNHVRGKSISDASIDALKELSYFAGMIDDTPLKEITSQLIFEFFADDKNADRFDPEFMADHAAEFTQFYFEKKKVDIKKREYLGRGFSIGWKDFYTLFQKPKSPLLQYLVDQIDELRIGQEGFSAAALHLLPQQYRRAILVCSEISSIKDTRALRQIFPNVFFIMQDIRKVREEVASNTQNSTAHLLLGEQSLFLNAVEAEKELRLAIQCDPNNEKAYAYLGYLLANKKQFTEAEEVCRKVVEINPKNAFAFYTLAGVAAHQCDFTEAEKLARKAIKLSPKWSKPHKLLANILLRQENFTEAEKLLRRALGHAPKQVDYLLELAKVFAKQGDLTRAKKVCRQVIARAPAAAAHRVLSSISLWHSDLEGAENEARYAERLEPNNAFSHIVLGQALKLKGDNKAAHAAFFKAHQLDQNSIEALSGLAGCLFANKGYKKAEKALSRVLELDPENPFAKRRLARIRSIVR